jgi:hypothetical protein
VSRNVTGLRVNETPTVLAASSVRVHVEPLLPLHAPVHDDSTESAFAVAVSVTNVPGAYGAVQLLPQSMPAGFEVTLPLPETLTDSNGSRLKLAPTVFAVFIETMHVAAEPVQAPLHPPNTEPTLGAAVSVTDVFTANCALQFVGHEIPAG